MTMFKFNVLSFVVGALSLEEEGGLESASSGGVTPTEEQVLNDLKTGIDADVADAATLEGFDFYMAHAARLERVQKEAADYEATLTPDQKVAFEAKWEAIADRARPRIDAALDSHVPAIDDLMSLLADLDDDGDFGGED